MRFPLDREQPSVSETPPGLGRLRSISSPNRRTAHVGVLACRGGREGEGQALPTPDGGSWTQNIRAETSLSILQVQGSRWKRGILHLGSICCCPGTSVPTMTSGHSPPKISPRGQQIQAFFRASFSSWCIHPHSRTIANQKRRNFWVF